MRLFLASNDLGAFGNELFDMVGKNRKVLAIFNARDYKTPDERAISVEKTFGNLSSIDLQPSEIDLKDYFGNSAGLRELVGDFDPGCIFVDGGNMYLLATALHLSGMDEIIRHDLAADKYVYAGYSAGAIVASKDLSILADSFGRRKGGLIEATRRLYGEVYQGGLGLIENYIIPHMDREDFTVDSTKARSDVALAGFTPTPLNDSDVFIVNGADAKVLRQQIPKPQTDQRSTGD